MELRYRQEAAVGFLVLVAVAILVFGLMWLRGRALGGRTVEVRAQFESVNQLKPDDPVLISGVVSGRVDAVELRGFGDVLVTLAVPPAYRARMGAWAEVSAFGFVGEVIVNYSPGEGPELPDTALIAGRSSASIEAVAGRLVERADELLGKAPDLLDQLAVDLRGTLRATERAMTVLSSVGEGGAVGQMTATLAAFESAAVQLDSTLANPGLVTALNGLDELGESMNEMVTGLAGFTVSLQSVLSKVDSGQGTMGKLVNDSTLYRDLHELARALTALLIDLRERPGRYLTVKVF